MRSVLAALLWLGLAASPVGAQAPVAPDSTPDAAAPWRFGWVVDMTVDFGGEAVAELQFTNGDRQRLSTGDGFSFSGGVEIRPATLPRLALRSLVGWKLSTSAAENVEIWFRRVPVELEALYDLNRDWRVGAGLVYHLRPTLDLDGLAPDQNFDSAPGLMLELAWRPLAITYTHMDYRRSDGAIFGADAFAFSFSYVFGKR